MSFPDPLLAYQLDLLPLVQEESNKGECERQQKQVTSLRRHRKCHYIFLVSGVLSTIFCVFMQMAVATVLVDKGVLSNVSAAIMHWIMVLSSILLLAVNFLYIVAAFLRRETHKEEFMIMAGIMIGMSVSSACVECFLLGWNIYLLFPLFQGAMYAVAYGLRTDLLVE